jgi:hypothetical protein
LKTVAIWATDGASSSHYDDNDNHECFRQTYKLTAKCDDQYHRALRGEQQSSV